MDDIATACDDCDPDAIGLWSARTLPRAVASRTRVGFGALGPDLRRFAQGACSDRPGLLSPYVPGTPTHEFLLRLSGSPSEQRAITSMGRAATRWSPS